MERAQEAELTTAEGRDNMRKDVEARLMLEEEEGMDLARDGGGGMEPAEEVEGIGEELFELVRFNEEKLEKGR